jgi:hypothetical protein
MRLLGSLDCPKFLIIAHFRTIPIRDKNEKLLSESIDILTSQLEQSIMAANLYKG